MKILAILVSMLFLGLATLHIFVDSVTIDAIGVVLIVLAALPWVFPYLKALELPGGVKIELKDVQSAVDQVKEELENSFDSDAYEYLQLVSEHDPNLALVAIRIEIEKAVRASLGDKMKHPSLTHGLGQLVNSGVLSNATASGLKDFIKLGNHAAHGVPVDKDAADLAIKNAPRLLVPFKAQLAKVA